MDKTVFISHSSRDRATATAVCDWLEARSLKCWIAPRDIQPGQSWGESIVRALDACPIMLLVLTAQANASRHVVKEVERADGKLARIVTFRVEDVVLNPSLEYFLSAEHWLDAVSRPLERHLPALVDAVQNLQRLGRQSQKAPTAEPEPRIAAVRNSELVATFEELAPDDWNRTGQGKFGHFMRRLFQDC
jgi:hypothetical protein